MKMSAPTPEMIGVREFARRDGCDEKLVRNAIRDGHLTAVGRTKLDAAQVGTGWRLRNRRAADTPADTPADTVRTVRTSEKVSAPPTVDAAPPDDPAAAAERILSASGAPWSQAEAERVKENYLALLRQLEYDLKAGLVVLVADVARLVGQDYARVRTRLLAIAAENAPQLARITKPAEMQEALQRLIAAALQNLTQDKAYNA